ncbi:MAG: D-alanine--D-alanine ligase, partial [Candidatus Methylomirabilis sp.]|nr:D-alanine--D-alanine ligase [Deltaproteobacteria bacterium]
MKKPRVGVLMGGVSSEREISLKTGEAVMGALGKLGYDVLALDLREHIAARVLAGRLDVAFIALHGKYGEDGCIQGMLEIMGLPYTGSGVLASALAMNKWKSRIVFNAAGIPTPKTIHMTRAEAKTWKSGRGGLRPPVVVKPVAEGSSVGVAIARTQKEFAEAAREAFKYDPEILVEEYV